MIARALAVAAALGCCACAPIVRYTDEIVSDRSGRTIVTRAPAALGGVVGFIGGVPLDIAALPITWSVYALQDEVARARDPLSIFLFPSFVLWQVGVLLSAPIDVVEWGVWRWWQQEDAMTPEERERRERELDRPEWPDYPVTPLYPKPARG